MGPLFFRPTVRVLSLPGRAIDPYEFFLLGLLRFEPLVAALLYLELTLPLLFVAEEVGVPFEHRLSLMAGHFHAIFDCASRLPHLMRCGSAEIVK